MKLLLVVQYYREQMFERGGFETEKALADGLKALLVGYYR